ncbi:hypothetical protein GCM10010303_34840 [Streptomyces purpurascens]|nr:hypothetical protein GCM10010303_34840 [Streptomyces purpurascens]
MALNEPERDEIGLSKTKGDARRPGSTTEPSRPVGVRRAAVLAVRAGVEDVGGRQLGRAPRANQGTARWFRSDGLSLWDLAQRIHSEEDEESEDEA